MSRQVLSSVFPFLKVEWALSDTQLGGLVSVVSLTVAALAVPLSLLGDRWGRVKSIVLMASIWSLATLGSAIAANYEQLMLARVFIGVGEAAYGSVGLAVVLAVFPVYRRASLTGAFLAGGSFGSVLGVALGGALAVHFGWRWTFAAMAIVGLVLVVLYRLLISDKKLDAAPRRRRSPRASRCPRRGSGPSCAPCSAPRRSSPPTSAAACSCSSPARCSPGCPATSAAPTAWPRTRPPASPPSPSCSWAPA